MDRFPFDEQNQALRQQGLQYWSNTVGPRVGDYVEFPGGDMKRICERFGERFQIADPRFGSSFYWAWWYCSHSGGCGDVFNLDRLADTGREADGTVWFFHHDQTGPHRGVTCTIPCRIYRLQENLSTRENSHAPA